MEGLTAGPLSPPAPIRADHEVSGFDSGVPALDEWLRRRALANEVAGASRTFVACAAAQVVGYYSLAAASIVHAGATSRARRNMPDPLPAILLARLAVDLRAQSQGLGAAMLQDAAMRVAVAADVIGVRVFLVHALTEAAARFYERFGFRRSPIDSMTLTVTLSELRETLNASRS